MARIKPSGKRHPRIAKAGVFYGDTVNKAGWAFFSKDAMGPASKSPTEDLG
jgi:hypothetical protein